MTRAERAAEKVRKEKEKTAALKQRQKEERAAQTEKERHAQAAASELRRQDDNKRCYHVGAMAQEAGLFTWENADIQAVFAVLARLLNAPAPAALLDGLLEAEMQEVCPDPVLVADKSLSRDGIFPCICAQPDGGNRGN
jgi:hypothetical protein